MSTPTQNIPRTGTDVAVIGAERPTWHAADVGGKLVLLLTVCAVVSIALGIKISTD